MNQREAMMAARELLDAKLDSIEAQDALRRNVEAKAIYDVAVVVISDVLAGAAERAMPAPVAEVSLVDHPARLR